MSIKNTMTPSPIREPFKAEGLVTGNVRINDKVYEPKEALAAFPKRRAYLHDLLSRTWEHRVKILEDIGLPLYIPSAYSKKKI